MIENTHQVIQDALQDYDRIEWKRILSDLEKAPNITYLPRYPKRFWLDVGIKGLIGHLEG